MSDFTTDVAVRYDDIDTYGHVNNVRYGTYLEEARIDYLTEIVGGDTGVLSAEDGGTGIVVKTLEIEFHRPVTGVDTVTVAVGVSRLGTTSFTLEYEVLTDGETAATAETTLVTYDREDAEPTAVPEDWRDAIESFEGL